MGGRMFCGVSGKSSWVNGGGSPDRPVGSMIGGRTWATTVLTLIRVSVERAIMRTKLRMASTRGSQRRVVRVPRSFLAWAMYRECVEGADSIGNRPEWGGAHRECL